MNIVVAIKQVPDLVEELELNDSGTDLDREWLKFKVNEFDEHALEAALLLKDAQGAQVTVVALDNGLDIDKALYAAAAKGADRVVKVTGDFEGYVSSHAAAKALAGVISGMSPDLVLTGVQAVDDLDGQLAVLLAHELGMPHITVVTDIEVNGSSATVQKEYGGGMVGEFEVQLPVTLGIQAAAETPRYVPVAKVRRAMKSTDIEEISGDAAGAGAGFEVTKMFKPETGQGAEMLSGSADDVAARIVEIIKSKGV